VLFGTDCLGKGIGVRYRAARTLSKGWAHGMRRVANNRNPTCSPGLKTSGLISVIFAGGLRGILENWSQLGKNLSPQFQINRHLRASSIGSRRHQGDIEFFIVT